MKKIIALRGDKDTGKSETIGILFHKMRKNGYVVIQDKKRQNSRDFFVVLKKNGVMIGVSTYGDVKSMILSRIYVFIELHCDIIVCACHNKGKTVEAIMSVKGYDVEFVGKSVTYKASEQASFNKRDAETLFKSVENLLP